MTRGRQKEFGDFQTPPELARAVMELIAPHGYASVVEPTCGVGAFLAAADELCRGGVPLFGFEIDPAHLARARERLPAERVKLERADFFTHDWRGFFRTLPEPILVVGNPPWVTNAEQGRIGGTNLPIKTNLPALKGLDAKTGRANFDVSEWMIIRLLEALCERRATVALLIKTSVARRALAHAWKNHLAVSECALYEIDAARHFGVAVDACLLVVHTGGAREYSCRTHPALTEPPRTARWGWADDRLVADLDGYARTRHLSSGTGRRWRSGIKHDAAAIMELTPRDGAYHNGLGERCDVEPDRVYPLYKAADLARDRRPSAERALLLPQLSVGEETQALETALPRTWRYLLQHATALDARKSSIYKRRPRFSIFGVGHYTFAPYKVAISGLHKSLEFRCVPPRDGRPVVFDDTCYFLAFDTEAEASETLRVLCAPPARDLYSALIFWDAKRPITADVLGRLDLAALKHYAERAR